MRKSFIAMLALVSMTFGSLAPVYAQQNGNVQQNTTETIVLIRHGEKTAHELGQLNVRGLNRSLAIPDVLIGKYGKPDYIFAPNPSAQIGARGGASYSYIRPLATIEPTAIRLGMPVNTQIGFGDIQGLQTELAKPIYANSLIFIAWEHVAEDRFTKNVMTTYAKDDSSVPDWAGNDYDSIFVIRLVRSGNTTTTTFTHDYENLNNKLSDAYPGPNASH
jgi:hypothetical protein